MVEAHETRVLGARFEFVARLRPDQRYATPLPHVRELLARGAPMDALAEDARGAGLDLVTWDDQMAVATRTAGLRWMSVLPLAFTTCASAELWAEACDTNEAAAQRVVDEGGVVCAPVRLSFVIAALASRARDCGYPWGARCGLNGVDLPPRWRRWEAMHGGGGIRRPH
jgi:hypothetical protein